MKAYPLDIKFSRQGLEEVIYPVLLQHGTNLVLVDCGYPGFMPLLEEALQQMGYSLKDLTGILITHHDIDHVGALAEIKDQYQHLKIYASATEAAYINGTQKAARLQQAEDLQPNLPAEQQEGGLAFQEYLKSVRPVEVDVLVSDTAETELFPGTFAIPTPGHTPGHISLYLPQTKVLIAADALVVENGALEIANPNFTLDLPAALTSIKRLADLEIEHLYCFHGGYVEGNIKKQMQQLLARYSLDQVP